MKKELSQRSLKQVTVNSFCNKKLATFLDSEKTFDNSSFSEIDDYDLATNKISRSELLDKMISELAAILEWDEFEVKLYVHLLRVGPMTASALAKEIAIDRTKTYRAMHKLVNQGLVTTTFSSPKLCIPVSPKEAIQNILQRKENEILRIKKGGIKIIEKIHELCPTTDVSNYHTYHVVQGLQNIFSYVEKLLENASDVVYIVTTLKTISKMYHTSIPDKIKICERNGCEVRLLTELDDPRLQLFVNRLKATNTKFVKLPSKGMVIVSKDKQLIISGQQTRGHFSINDESETALCANSQELVSNLFYMCTFLWENSHSLKTSRCGEKDE